MQKLWGYSTYNWCWLISCASSPCPAVPTELRRHRQVKVSQGRATGVTLRNGAEIMAPLVVSAAGAEATAKLLPQFAPAERLEGGISHMSHGMTWDGMGINNWSPMGTGLFWEPQAADHRCCHQNCNEGTLNIWKIQIRNNVFSISA